MPSVSCSAGVQLAALGSVTAVLRISTDGAADILLDSLQVCWRPWCAACIESSPCRLLQPQWCPAHAGLQYGSLQRAVSAPGTPAQGGCWNSAGSSVAGAAREPRAYPAGKGVRRVSGEPVDTRSAVPYAVQGTVGGEILAAGPSWSACCCACTCAGPEVRLHVSGYTRVHGFLL
jgi:hypothetical protein